MLAALNQVSVLDLSGAMHPVLGQMVNVGFGPAGILGLCLAGAGAGLYLLRSTRPELARDYDIFFSAIGLLCGGILFFNGWRLDPILMFGQVLMAGSAVFFAFESIRLRSITTDQARRGGGGSRPIVDDERSYDVDQVYRAEIDEIEPFMEERPPMRRIRGSRDTEASDRAAYNSAYGDSGYSNDSYGGSEAGYSSRRGSRSSRRGSRSSRSDANAAYSSDAAYGRDSRDSYGTDSYNSDSYGGSESSYGSSSTSDWGSSGGSSSEYSSRRSTSRDESSGSSRRSSSRRSSSRDRYYDDEAPAPRSSRRSRYDSSRSSRSSQNTNDDYVDYKPISNYSEERSSSSYGSRRPANDYDDEWGS